MKLSLKLQDDHQQHHQGHGQDQHQRRPLLLRAKIPITIFNLPFLSGFSTTTHHPTDLSLSLATNFHSGPTLKLSYSTSSTTTGASTVAGTVPPPPLTLTLKSGIGLFGSPNNSPLVISANFSFSPQNANANPSFSLLFKPQFGSFSFRKTTVSNPGSGNSGSFKPNGESSNAFGFVPLDRPGVFKDFSAEESGKDSIFKGISVMARTEMPVGKRVMANLRWGVSFPEDIAKGTMMGMPYLTVNKIGIERVDEVQEEKGVKEKKDGSNNQGDVELLKGMCSWMKRELDMLQRENREMRVKLEELKMGHLLRSGSNGGGLSEGAGKKVVSPVAENSGGFEQWRNKKNGGEENVKKDAKKNGNRASDVESELQRAIKAASS